MIARLDHCAAARRSLGLLAFGIRRPEKVILFGSRARGNMTADSDLDLLVVMDFQGSKLDKMVKVREVLNGINVPADILIR